MCPAGSPHDAVPGSPHDAVILAIGSELTTGETRDTNGGDLAADLSRLGLHVDALVALPDDLALVTAAFRNALESAEVVVATGGLGPTPDDLTREALAAALGATPAVDDALERWLRHLFERRGIRMPDANRKQAWLIPGAEPLLNDHGTAPGWWVEREGRVVVLLPGPPREMGPMWSGDVLPRLRKRGFSAEVAVRTLRLTGIGESHVVEALGEEILRASNPVVATYARPDAVDVRITARPEAARDGGHAKTAVELLASAQAHVEARLGRHVFGYDDDTWAEALGRRLHGRTLATQERGTGGALAALLGDAPWFVRGEVLGAEVAPAVAAAGARGAPRPRPDDVAALRARAGADVALALDAVEHDGDTHVHVGLDVGGRHHAETRTAFLGGEQGRRRAALAACAALWDVLDNPD